MKIYIQLTEANIADEVNLGHYRLSSYWRKPLLTETVVRPRNTRSAFVLTWPQRGQRFSTAQWSLTWLCFDFRWTLIVDSWMVWPWVKLESFGLLVKVWLLSGDSQFAILISAWSWECSGVSWALGFSRVFLLCHV